jgi:hypothetical protein
MTRKEATKRKEFVQSDPDGPFFLRLKERLVYLRNRRWVQLSALALFIALGIWGYFYVRSLLPRTPAQHLDIQTDTLQTQIQVQDALSKLELLRAMLIARREEASIERYRALIANTLQTTFEGSPKELRAQWRDIDNAFNQLQMDMNNGSETTLTTLEGVIARLQRLEFE